MQKHSFLLRTFSLILEMEPKLSAYLSIPGTLVEHFKLHQDLGQLVVVLDDAPSLVAVQQLRALLKRIHRLLDATEHLPRPRDLAGDGRQVATDGRVVLVALVVLGGVLDLPAKALQDLGILLMDTKIWHIDSVGETKIF